MNVSDISRILSDTAYVRTSGSDAEKRCTEYLKEECRKIGFEAKIEEFEIPSYRIKEALLEIDSEKILCKGYFNSGSSTVEAPLYYLSNTDELSLKKCEGKIVLADGNMGYWPYRDILANGAVGFITYTGNVNYADNDIDQKELRELPDNDKRIPGVSINVKDAVRIAAKPACIAKISIVQENYTSTSHNVIIDLPGESDETVIFSAHYDSTHLSTGAYDNMSGCIALLFIAERLSKIRRRCSVRFLWCGSEERGLLGSKAYCAQHKDELSDTVLNINLDMLGCVMGRFVAFATDEKMKQYMKSVAEELDMGIDAVEGIRSSDSSVFSDLDIPAATFARYAPGNTATIHNRYDTASVISPDRLMTDISYISAFAEKIVTDSVFPFDRAISEKVREDLDKYFHRKR